MSMPRAARRAERPRAAGTLKLRRAPVQARARMTTESIVDAFERIAAARGASAASIRAIAIEAGVSVGAIYEFFPGRRSVVAHYLRRTAHGIAAITARHRAAIEGGARGEALATMAAELMALFAPNAALWHELMWLEPTIAPDREARALLHRLLVPEYRAIAVAWRGSGAATLLPGAPDPALAAELLYGLWIENLRALMRHAPAALADATLPGAIARASAALLEPSRAIGG